MEIFLHLWDELDDLAILCRHAATSTDAEVFDGAEPLVAGAAALGVMMLEGASRLLRLTA